MKILVLCSYRAYAPEGIAPFVKEQMEDVARLGAEVQYYILHRKGVKGYLKELKDLRLRIEDWKPDIIHAHYGLCGLLACLQRSVPVVTTYHGSDINSKKVYRLSKWAVRWSDWNIFVSSKLMTKAKNPKSANVIPCGVDTSIFYPRDKAECRRYFKWDEDKKYVLFSKAFSVPVKNYPLAKAAVNLLQEQGHNIELVELKGYTREEVAMLMNACDCALMTSFSEGSPQFVKEALACNIPIVSTDVGDVRDVINGIATCRITRYDAEIVANDILFVIKQASIQPKEEQGIIAAKFSREIIAHQIDEIYQKLYAKI